MAQDALTRMVDKMAGEVARIELPAGLPPDTLLDFLRAAAALSAEVSAAHVASSERMSQQIHEHLKKYPGHRETLGPVANDGIGPILEIVRAEEHRRDLVRTIDAYRAGDPEALLRFAERWPE